MLPEVEYVKASGVDDAIALIGRHGAEARLLAGGTDLLVDLREKRKGAGVLIDISEIAELATIGADAAAFRLGACVLVGVLGEHEGLAAEYPALAAAVRSFADYLTRNKATLGGNLANASPGADLAVPLIALGASVVLAGPGAERTLALEDFLLGPRSTALAGQELLREVVIPRPAPAGQAYEKLGIKRGGAISVVSSTVTMNVLSGRCVDVSIALGAVAPRPFRCGEAERLVEGETAEGTVFDAAAAEAARRAEPITDVRGSAEYRRAMVQALVRRGLEAAWARATVLT